MPSWFLFALAGPFLWSAANFMDKYTLQKYFRNRGSGALLIFTGLYGLVPMLLIGMFSTGLGDFSLSQALWMILSGVLYLVGFLPYLYALQTEEASKVTPLFQLSPVVLYFLGWTFLHETLTVTQLMAGGLIVVGAVAFSTERSNGRVRVRWSSIVLMLLAVVLLSITSIIFKKVALETTFWVTAFWEYLGGLVGAILLYLVPAYRRDFHAAFRTNAKRIIGLNIANDTLNTSGSMLFAYATLLGPVALVATVNGLQPLILVVMGIVLTKFFPRLGRETIDRRTVTVKIVAGILMFIGVYALNAVS